MSKLQLASIGFKLCALLLICSIAPVEAYRPVAMIHGITSDAGEFPELKGWLQQDFPGIKTFALDAFDDYNSFPSAIRQISWFGHLLERITDQYGEVTLLGFSQGGFLARGVVQMSDNPFIHTFISASAPAMGEFGLPDFPDWKITNETRDNIWRLCYNHAQGFEALSVCDYWKDPTKFAMYLNVSETLPYINNEILTYSSQRYKLNFENLQRLVLIGGPDDDVIIPWQSAHYGYYNAELDIVLMKDQEVYQKNSFGLKTLDEAGKISVCTYSDVYHTSWIINHTVYENCIKPYIG